MKTSLELKHIGLGLFLAGALSCGAARGQEVTQNVTLQLGWNSIWLEVQPTNTGVGAVFAGLPVDSVWTYQERLSAVDFIQDPSEPVWNKNKWLVWLPTGRAESFQNTLFHVQANRAYLVRMTNSATLSVAGRPSLRALEWAPSAYNLRGLPVDSSQPPTFEAFFRSSPAHYDTSGGQVRPIYRLNGAGQWTLVGATDPMERGVAYWVYCQGGSDYQGPLSVRLAWGDGLDYGPDNDRLLLRLNNSTGSALTASLQDVLDPVGNALSRYSLNLTNGVEWVPLLTNPPAPYTLPLAAGEQAEMPLAIRRGDFPGEQYATVLEVNNGSGVRVLVPVSASKSSGGALTHAFTPGGKVSLMGAGGRPTKSGSSGGEAEARAHAGLWWGTARVNAVAEVNSTNALAPTPTKAEFPLLLLIHVDTNGVARLLKEVIQMWKEGTYTNDAQGRTVAAEPGRFVLVTDETRLSQFTGATLRDGEPVGRRLSTIGFDFPSSPTNNFLPLAGYFAVSNTLAGAITLTPDFATNPFKHKYHPDHDNLDATFHNYRAEAYEITRAFSLEFTGNTLGAAAPNYGYNVIAGHYQEVVTGLHKTNLVASGTFQLNRVAVTGTLNE